MSLLSSPCFVVEATQPWDDAAGKIHPPRGAPGPFDDMKGFCLVGLGWPEALELPPHRVIIATSKSVARALGIRVGDDGRDTIGLFQSLPDGRFGVLLPIADYDKRRERSETWKQFWLYTLKRCSELAAGKLGRHEWGRLEASGDEVAIEAALDMIEASSAPLSTDLETSGDMPNMIITAFGLAVPGCSVSIPWTPYISRVFGPQAADACFNSRIQARVKRLMADPRRTKVFHNGSFDVAVLRKLGIPLAGEIHDTILAMKALYGELYRNLQFSAGLAAIFEDWKTQFKGAREAALLANEEATKRHFGRKLSKALDDWRELPFTMLLAYNAKDTAATSVLWTWLEPKISADPRLAACYAQLQRLAAIAADQWVEGAPLDPHVHAEITRQTRRQTAQMLWEWRRLVGPNVPAYGPGSGAALQRLFMETLKAPKVAVPESKGAKGAKKAPKAGLDGQLAQSLSSYVLLCWDALAKKDAKRQRLADAAFLLFRIRKLRKNYTAFFVPLRGKQRIFPSPSVVGTLGTRFSYSNPNIQQWPKNIELSRFSTGEAVLVAPDTRQLVVAPPGYVLWESDYSALELRAVGYRTKTQMWFDWMRDNKDMHIEHVELMFGIRVSKKNDPDNLRQIAKVAIYARFYNVSANPDAVVKQLKPKMPSLEREMVVEVFTRLDNAIPSIPGWHAEAAARDRRLGYVETGLGGWRIPTSRKRPDENRNRSFEIQSTVGHIVATAEVGLTPMLADIPGSRMLFQVHDSFVGLCREDRVAETLAAVKTAMEWEVPELWGNRNIHFPVEIKVGPDWGHLSTYHTEEKSA